MLAGTIVQFQSYPPLGPIHNVIWNPGRTTSLTILRPTLWQKQLTIQESVKIASGVSQVDGYDAMLRPTNSTAPLCWTPGVFVPFFTSLVSSIKPIECGPEWSFITIS